MAALENAFSMLIKFQNYNRLADLQQGNIYMKKLQYFIDLEKETQDENKGDKYEGKMIINDVNILAVDYETNKPFFNGTCSRISMDFGYSQCPVFCMFLFDFRNCDIKDLGNNHLELTYQFTELQKSKLKAFGDYALVITNGNEFLNRIKKAFIAAGVNFQHGKVLYYSGNKLEVYQRCAMDEAATAFLKREKYDFQQEYRLVATDIDVEDHWYLNIGSIKDISKIVPIDEMLNIKLKATCTAVESITES